MRLHVLQHVPFEGPAAIQDWAAARGHSLTTTAFYANPTLPALDSFEMLVVMGGPMNIYQDRDHPWLKNERRFIAQTIGARKKVLGVCLGSQLIADALGSRVFQNSHVEIGWFPIRFSVEARQRLPQLPDLQLALHWHGDTFELPHGACRLAESDACTQQGFWFEDHVLALQFHPEIQPAVLQTWCEEFAPTSAKYIQSIDSILNPAPDAYSLSRQTLFHLLDEL